MASGRQSEGGEPSRWTSKNLWGEHREPKADHKNNRTQGSSDGDWIWGNRSNSGASQRQQAQNNRTEHSIWTGRKKTEDAIDSVQNPKPNPPREERVIRKRGGFGDTRRTVVNSSRAGEKKRAAENKIIKTQGGGTVEAGGNTFQLKGDNPSDKSESKWSRWFNRSDD